MRFARLRIPATSPFQFSCLHAAGALASLVVALVSAGCSAGTNSSSAVTDAGWSALDAGWQCSSDDACGDMEFCDSASHACDACTVETELPLCENGLVGDWIHGNGCVDKVCCENGTGLDPETGGCVGFATLEIEACPWTRVFECYIRFFDVTDAPLSSLPTMTSGASANEPGAFALHNSGKAPLHISSMGLTAESSTDFRMVTAPRTELAAGEVMVIQFSYQPDGHARDEGEFVIVSDATNGHELRVPIIGDTSWTQCTRETVKQTCIAGQYCDGAMDPPACADCFDPLTPMCSRGRTIAVEPEGSFKCAEFFCQCGPEDVYVNSRGCKPIVPCTESCLDCRRLCKRYPSKFCDESQMVETCVDG